jgi:hypothetical protein
MPHYSVLKKNIIPRITTDSTTTTTTTSPARGDFTPLHPLTHSLDKRALYTCLKKLTIEINTKSEFPQYCVDRAAACEDDHTSFHTWLEKQLHISISEEEAKGLLDYLRLVLATSPYCQAVSPEDRMPVFGTKMCSGSVTDRQTDRDRLGYSNGKRFDNYS